MDSAEPKSRWYRLTPGSLIAGLLAAECFLWASQHFAWFAFNRHKGWTVLIAVAAVGAVLAVLLVWWLAAAVFRLRFQFSIRALLVLALAVALPSSWLAVEMKKAKAQKEAVAEIEKLGGGVTYYRASSAPLSDAARSGCGPSSETISSTTWCTRDWTARESRMPTW
jgi:hypothetical protein